MRTPDVAHDERGLIGKILIVWLVVLVVLGVGAFDTVKILYARYKVADAAQEASFDAASALEKGGNRQEAYQAAVAAVQQKDPDARIPPKNGFVIDPKTNQVTVTVTKKVSTLIAGRIGFLKKYTKATATDTSEPPTL